MAKPIKLGWGVKDRYLLMKKKIKQWWSTITPISTKRTITSHLFSLNTKRGDHNN